MSAPSQGRKTASLGRADGKPSYLAKNESKFASGSLGQSESKTSSVGRSESKTHKGDEGQYQSKKSSSLPRKSSNVSRKSVDRERRKSGDRDKSSRCSSPNTEDPEGEVPVASRPRSNSGRTLTDEVIPPKVVISVFHSFKA